MAVPGRPRGRPGCAVDPGGRADLVLLVIRFIKKLRRIVASYDKDQAELKVRALAGLELIRERTDLHMDIGHRAAENQIIMVGRYRGRDFVQVYSVEGAEFEGVLSLVRRLQGAAVVRRVDAPQALRAAVEREVW